MTEMTTTDASAAHARHASSEKAPLLTHISMETGESNSEDSSEVEMGGSASVMDTMMNLAKSCMGTACLTLPYAAKQGGALLFLFGTFGIALWNVFSAIRLTHCWDLLVAESSGKSQDEEMPTKPSKSILKSMPSPPAGTATLGKVAWYALGPTGLVVLDSMIVVLFVGILVAFNDAIRTFLQATPFHTGSDVMDASLIAILIASLSIVPDMSYLTKTSAAGLVVMFSAFMVVAAYGLFGRDDTSMVGMSAFQWLPRNGLTGVSQWFGCIVFGYGIVPVSFNFRESMGEPSQFPRATLAALILVAIAYVIMGWGFLFLFPDINGEILSELPANGVFSTLTRLAMSIVYIATAPLLLVPCGEIVEGKIQAENFRDDSQRLQTTVRFGLCFVAVAISVGIPSFVSVLTLVGCFCVAMVGFCIPPGLHLIIIYRQRCQYHPHAHHDGSPQPDDLFHWDRVLRTIRQSWRFMWVDALFLLWGLTATVISTTFVFRQQMGGVGTQVH